eukprot:3174019-Alexandrium_andersonii.AAC.1
MPPPQLFRGQDARWGEAGPRRAGLGRSRGGGAPGGDGALVALGAQTTGTATTHANRGTTTNTTMATAPVALTCHK